MLGIAFLPPLCWSFSSWFSARATKALGTLRATFWRTALALVLLSLWVWMKGSDFPQPEVTLWLALSGFLGLGLGDLAMFAAYKHLGPRVVVLILMGFAVPITALVEWIWLGVPLETREMICIMPILLGSALVVAPGASLPDLPGASRLKGLALAFLAAFCQGLATPLSRVAYDHGEGTAIDAAMATWIRMAGGMVFFLILASRGRFLPVREPFLAGRGRLLPARTPVTHSADTGGASVEGNTLLIPARTRVTHSADALAPGVLVEFKKKFLGLPSPWWFLIGATLFGPVIGLTAYQWALMLHSGALVQALACLVPVAVIPLTWWADGDRPGWMGWAGALMACGGAIGLALG